MGRGVHRHGIRKISGGKSMRREHETVTKIGYFEERVGGGGVKMEKKHGKQERCGEQSWGNERLTRHRREGGRGRGPWRGRGEGPTDTPTEQEGVHPPIASC